jgi:hypothetical protein
MKNVHTTIAKTVAAILFASFAGIAAAGGTQDITVSATVSAVCKFPTQTLTLTFDAIDPSSLTDATKDVTVPFKCTNGVTPTITPSSLNGGNLKSGAETLAYGFALQGSMPAGTGFSAVVNATYRGTITQANFQNAKALTYTDTVTLTINN